jgi:hypothetical protein
MEALSVSVSKKKEEEKDKGEGSLLTGIDQRDAGNQPIAAEVVEEAHVGPLVSRRQAAALGKQCQ